jgi:enamine deaminase RidA (YjgF/YER057c/UK114 family)
MPVIGGGGRVESRRVKDSVKWESVVGYCRAIRRGAMVAVSGCAPVAADGSVHAPGDAYEQARRCIEIALGALRKLGGAPSDVIRTRIFVADISRWTEVGRAHQEAFGQHPPATSMVEVKSLIDPAMLVEIEVDAVVD